MILVAETTPLLSLVPDHADEVAHLEGGRARVLVLVPLAENVVKLSSRAE